MGPYTKFFDVLRAFALQLSQKFMRR
jgi:hypothetical protein